MSISKRGNSPYYHFEFVCEGVRFRGSTRTADRRAAERIERAARTRAAEGRFLARKKEMKIREAVHRYWEEHGKHCRNATDLFSKLEALSDGLGPDALLHRIGTRELADYQGWRREQGARGGRSDRDGRPGRPIGNATINRDLVIFKAVRTRARDLWEIEVGREPNWRGLRLTEPAARKRHLSQREHVRLLDELRPDLVPLVLFALATGARKTNCYRLEWNDVDFAGRTITLRNVKGREAGKTHTLPMTPGLAELLHGVEGHHPKRVFTYICRRRGADREPGKRYPLTQSNWQRDWRRALDVAEIEDFKFHDLRHTAATWLLRATSNLALAKELLGHCSVEMTMRYAHAMTQDLAAGMAQVSTHKIPTQGNGRGDDPAVSASTVNDLPRSNAL